MIASLRARASGTVERDVRRDLGAEANAKAAALGIAAVLVAFAIAAPIKFVQSGVVLDPITLVVWMALPLVLAVGCSFVYRLEQNSRVPLLLIALALAVLTGPYGAVGIAAAVLPFVGTRAQMLFTPEYQRLCNEQNATRPNLLRSPWLWSLLAAAAAQWWLLNVSSA